MQVYHIMDGPPLYTNCFLLIGENKKAVAIDPNADAQRFIDVLEENSATLTHILLTHGHDDHIASVEPLRSKYNALVYMNKADADFFNINTDVFFEDGGSFTIDGMAFSTIFTPGHTPGSTCIRCGDLLFAGDTLFADDIGRTDLPGGDTQEIHKSLRKLCEAITDDVQVLPGHEEFSTLAHEKAHNRYLQFHD